MIGKSGARRFNKMNI